MDVKGNVGNECRLGVINLKASQLTRALKTKQSYHNSHTHTHTHTPLNKKIFVPLCVAVAPVALGIKSSGAGG